jgi:hypothetical protein
VRRVAALASGDCCRDELPPRAELLLVLLLLIVSVVVLELLIVLRVRVTFRLTVSQSVCLGVEPRLKLMTRYLFMFGKLQSCLHGGALSDERTGLSFVSHSPQ